MAARGGYKGGTGKAVFQNAPGAHIAAFFVSWINPRLRPQNAAMGQIERPRGQIWAAPVQLAS